MHDNPSTEHKLYDTDVRANDKMSVNAAKKICSPDVIKMLESKEDYKGTLFYVKLMNQILTSFENDSLSDSERIKMVKILS